MNQAGTPTGRMRPARRAWLAAFGLAGCPLAVGCSSIIRRQLGDQRPLSTPSTSLASASATGATGTPAAAALGGLRKILVIMEENHSIQQVFPDGMPYLWSLARRYGYASNWSDVGHPSLPNYLAIFGGSAFDDASGLLTVTGLHLPWTDRVRAGPFPRRNRQGL